MTRMNQSAIGPAISYNQSSTICGCWHLTHESHVKQYLPLLDLKSHTTILATTSRTRLAQTFHNPQNRGSLDEVQYTFPLYDGVSLVSFRCVVAGRTIVGVVKEKQQARADYQAAVDRGETASLLEQLPEVSDAHTTKIGNIPANEQVIVEIEYLGELKHDAETDGSRFTIPTVIAPRYGSGPPESHSSAVSRGISISVDIAVDEGSVIRGVQSPSHPIAVTMGRTSTTIDEDSFDNHHASTTLTLGTAALEKDFVLIVLAKGQDTPRALLETHHAIPNHRALMTTLVPKFNLPNIHPEIVFVVDRSGSMARKIPTLVAALKVFLKSIPVSARFNICSFGSHHKFMFDKSMVYNQSSLQAALDSVTGFAADFGGTEMYSAIEATVKNRLPRMPLEMLVLTDGQIWDQEKLFDYIRKSCTNSPLRVFSLGIGSGASSSLVEGIARAGDGFAQFVDDNEKMDKRVVRMLKAALSPHIKDYKLEVKYAKAPDSMEDEYEIIESVDTGISKLVIDAPKLPQSQKKVISLFDTSAKETPPNPATGRYDHLPSIAVPAILQAPHSIPSLYAFNRTTVYLLLGPDACQQTPSSVILRATSEHGPLELEIPVQDVGKGQTIHQLAAKKAVYEIEQGRGWLSASNFQQKLVGTQSESRMDEFIEREAVRLGVEFQVGGKFCSFVAVEDGAEPVSVPAQKPFHVGCRDGYSGSASSTSMRAGGGLARSLSGASNLGSAIYSFPPTNGNQYCRSRRRCAPMAPRKSAPSAELASSGYAAYDGGPIGATPSMQLQQQQMNTGQPSNQCFGASTSPGAPSPSLISKPALFSAGTRGSGPPDRARQRKRESSPPISGNDTGDELSKSDNDTGSFHGPSHAPLSHSDQVRALIDLNNFDGSWTSSARLVKMLGADIDAVKHWQRSGWSETQRMTAVVVAFLEVRLSGERDVWEMVVEKARDWLVGALGTEAEEGVEEVKGLLGVAI